jgi:hypothetical protein
MSNWGILKEKLLRVMEKNSKIIKQKTSIDVVYPNPRDLQVLHDLLHHSKRMTIKRALNKSPCCIGRRTLAQYLKGRDQANEFIKNLQDMVNSAEYYIKLSDVQILNEKQPEMYDFAMDKIHEYNINGFAVHNCTIYGDMAGGLSVIADVYKTTVYKLAAILPGIPENSITKPPSAELKPDQKDTDSLPPYEVLDGILKQYIERNKSYQEIVDKGFDLETVKKVIQMVDRNEYKRRQAAPSLIISQRDLTVGRRMPIANKFKQF